MHSNTTLLVLKEVPKHNLSLKFSSVLNNTLWCRKKGTCGERVMVAHLGCVLCLESHDCTHVKELTPKESYDHT